ncbi:hypothetical protein DER44DRAFT_178770 [Fusarium oxysporum]|nr:hypothetical protein DER44DRAFT_178770 [Fusarium oxysporum]
MAPSTTTPSNLHRAPVACLKCRAAKVRCLIQQNSDRCDRCTSNDSDCVFARPRRAKAGPTTHPYSRPSRPQEQGQEEDQDPDPDSDQQQQQQQHRRDPHRASSTASLPTAPGTIVAVPSPVPINQINHLPFHFSHAQEPLITPEIRTRIVAALATLKGKKGAPFSFVTSGDGPSAAARDENHNVSAQQPSASEKLQSSAASLKLSWLLSPLQDYTRTYDQNRQPSPLVKMPSYLLSMSLGQTVLDPIDDGILTKQASQALFQHFMLEMNAKWEYLLDPRLDTHDEVRRRSRLLFATILFCSSKFANYVDGILIPTTDPFLQSRLCSLARNLTVRTFAEGDRSIETMQAFYLLVCWKDSDDDISYRHSGYAFRVLHDLDWDQKDQQGRQAVRSRRTWLALFRQDKQQSLFFMRRSTPGLGDELASHLDTWLKMPHVLPQDYIACCSADLRRIQSKVHGLVVRAPSNMLPYLLELMDAELGRWKSAWETHFEREASKLNHNIPPLDRALLYPGKAHLRTLMGLWENSVRLNVSSEILRQSLIASVTSSLRANGLSPPSTFRLDLPGIPPIEEVLSPDIPGLRSSIQGGFETLRYLLEFPIEDLRRAPDSTLLLGPNAALFLCLLLCLPCNGVLGAGFQKTAVSLIQSIARHVGEAVRSPQDTLNLHSAYLESLASLLRMDIPLGPANTHDTSDTAPLNPGMQSSHLKGRDLQIDETAMEAAQVLAGGMVGRMSYAMEDPENMFGFTSEPEQALHEQSLVNLLDTSFFSAMSPIPMNMNGDTES